MTRQSTIRIISNVSKELGIKINIIEAEDGLECIYLLYKSLTQGVKISMIFSDENMNFMNGSRSCHLVAEILQRKNMSEIPFYLVTAYDESMFDNKIMNYVKKVLSKPLVKEIAKQIISDNFTIKEK